MNHPEFLGPYRIGESLGKGGMGSVFKAKHEKSGQEVAVKLIAEQVSDDMKFRRRFNAEVETLRRLSHPNIVSLIGYGEEQGVLFYSMELVDGESLQSRIRKSKKLQWIETIDISIQICAALKHAHDFGVIHRDLKPANLIVQSDGTLKLLDFGISKIFGQNQTAVGSIMGTADYMAPEQAKGEGTTSRTDLYALGCVMYAMLAGKPPFRGKNVTEVIAALTHQDPVPLDLIDPDLPVDLVQIVGELLEKSPEKRPPTALAVMNRLKAMRAGLLKMQTIRESDPESELELQTDDSIDTKIGLPNNPAADKTKIADADSYDQETVAYSYGDASPKTQSENVDASAATVQTEGHSGKKGTEPGTVARRADGVNVASRDTSVGATGQTHFQTVSDGEVRQHDTTHTAPKSDHPALRYGSILALAAALLAGIVFLAVSTRAPTAEELIAAIENPPAGTQSFQTQNEIERFLKMYPDHPKSESYREQQAIHRVDAAVKRLKLKAKLRTDEGPIYESSFIDAMERRAEDPAAAKQKLDQWLVVFGKEDRDEDFQELVELARFESGRLSSVGADGVAADSRLNELMERIEKSKQMPAEDRKELLESVITLYDDQPWAEGALATARELLQETE